MMVKVNSLKNKFREIAGRPWHPVTVAKVNDHIVRLALAKGEYHWHKHEKQDELFHVVKGRLVIQLRSQSDVTLNEGESAVIPKNLEHCPKSSGETYVLLFEPRFIQSKKTKK